MDFVPQIVDENIFMRNATLHAHLPRKETKERKYPKWKTEKRKIVFR